MGLDCRSPTSPRHYSHSSMRFAPIPVPDEIVEIHRPLGLFEPFRATIYFDTPDRFKSLPYMRGSSRGFISQNEKAFAFTGLSTLMDLGIYGMNRVIKKVSRGAEIDNAIESVIYSNGCGEFEIPHICSVLLFPFDAVSKITCHEDPASSSEMELSWKESSVVIFRVYKLCFEFNDEEFSISTPDSRVTNIVDKANEIKTNKPRI